MAVRPAKSNASFLAHIFSPKKAAKPTGIRKGKPLAVTTGRKATRVRAFNKLDAVKQEILRASGQRESYLRGETSLADAKRSLRPKAVSLGVAKPVRQRSRTPGNPAGRAVQRVTDLDRRVLAHFTRTMRDAGRDVNPVTVNVESDYLDPEPAMLGWDSGQFSYAGRPGSEYEVFVDGKKHNPFWYH